MIKSLLSLLSTFVAFMSISAYGQGSLDFNGHAAAFFGQEQNPIRVTITLAGLVFDESLVYNGTYATVEPPQTDIDYQNTAGYAWAGTSPSSGGDITESVDQIGCGRYKVTCEKATGGGNQFVFYLNLIDANWGLVNQPYHIAFELSLNGDDVEVNAYLADNGDDDLYGPRNISEGEEITYWDLVKELRDQNYNRNRTGIGANDFTFQGGDVPNTLFGPTEAWLDVNVKVLNDIAVPMSTTLWVDPDPDFIGTNRWTTLYFSQDKKMTINGTMPVCQIVSGSGRCEFTSGMITPAAGDWVGIEYNTSSLFNSNYFNIRYAQTGMLLKKIRWNTFDNLDVQYCDRVGIEILEGYPRFPSLFVAYTGWGGGVRIAGPRSSATITDAAIHSTGGNGISVGEGILVVKKSFISSNSYSGIMTAAGYARVDSCQIYSNQLFGINILYARPFGKLQWSRVFDNSITGISVTGSYLRGYPSGPYDVDPEDIPDTVPFDERDGFNYIYDNGPTSRQLNMRAFAGSIIELGRTFKSKQGVVHTLGGLNNIFFWNYYTGTLQAQIHDSFGHLRRNFWGYPTQWQMTPEEILTFQNRNGSSLHSPKFLDFTRTDCEEIATLPDSTSFGEPDDPMLAWWEKTRDMQALRDTVEQVLSSLTYDECVELFRWITEYTDSVTAETYYQTLLSDTAITISVRALVLQHLAKAQATQTLYSDAVDSFDQIVALTTPCQDSVYTASHSMAAYMQYLAGSPSSAFERLDTLLSTYPDDVFLQTMWNYLGGDYYSFPKRSALANEEVVNESLISLDALPNPITDKVEIILGLKEPMKLVLSVYDNLGRRIEHISSGFHDSGRHVKVVDMSDFPSGVYFVSLKSADGVLVRRLVLAR